MFINQAITLFESIINGSVKACNFIFTPIQLGTISISPIMLLSFGGLVAYLGIAIVKWLL